ncbi:hypothetical protein FISHEDRAFT_75996 [Fistulina hepatica ATCC 64428]|uniref:Fungal-type protein kinase domain-containing protein n=1 Tax=Fistulina hepatica ATCC 64428 TaxID=1128425 RepID=A0A0D7A5P8_9AGAR|nr:hypothetical protein FISHEDRAFT_75996 [Fistulina hepatica ATCC 64428]
MSSDDQGRKTPSATAAATEEHLKNTTFTPDKGSNSANLSTEWSTIYSDQFPETGQDHILDSIRLNLHFVSDNDHLEECLSKYTPKNFVPPTSINWLEKKIYETQYYGLLAEYLNNILARAREAYYTGNEPVVACALDTVFTKDFRWFPFDRQAVSQFSSNSKLKPDLAGAILENPVNQVPILTTAESMKSSTNNATISWEHAATFGEVKRSWLNMVVRAASHARQIFAHQPHRTSVRCILFNQQTKMAAIAEFDRGGGYGTHWCDLGNTEGVRRFSELLAGMYCSPTDANGYSRRIRVESDGRGWPSLRVWARGSWFYVSKILCNRIAPCNDMDEIFDVQPNMDEDEYIQLGVSGKKRAAVSQGHSKEGKESEKKPRLTRAIVSVRSKVPVQVHSQDLHGDANNDKDDKSPFVQIEYWNHVLHRSDDDHAILSELSELRCKHGLLVRGLVSYGQRNEERVTLFAQGPAKDCKEPDYYFTDAYQGLNEDTKLPIQHAQDEMFPMSTKKFTDNLNASESSSTKVKTRLLNPYPLYETTQECLEVGYSLLEAKNGLDLIEGILGALYGYRNLYHLGYLHRDISPGNIIIVDPELRKEENVVDIVPNDRSSADQTTTDISGLNTSYTTRKVSEPTRGMLIDMSLVIKKSRANPASEENPGLRGTRMFIASNLLEDVRAKPSPVYDMESFFWTFVYMHLHQNQHQNLDSADANLLKQLVPGNREYQADSSAKFRLLFTLSEEDSLFETSVLYPYRSLVSTLARFSFNLLRKTFPATFQSYDSLTELGAIEQYITVFEQSLERFRSSGSC